MAFRPTQYLIEGELDNTNPKKVIGWMRFVGLKEKVTFDLEGNFHRDIRGAKIHFTGDAYEDSADIDSGSYFDGFAQHQIGKAGDITAGLPPHDYGTTPYAEMYSEQNGRIVLELESAQIEVIGTPIPAIESDPISRKEQRRNMAEFLCSIAQEMDIPQENVICVGSETVTTAKKRAANNRVRGMKLLPYKIRERLPSLGGQDCKGGKAVAYAKCFTPSSSWTWYITEGSPVRNKDNDPVDYILFGLVEGQCKELGYFRLSELESVRGPMGLPIERDLHWKPKTLEEIAPEMFGNNEQND
ncbi:MAG: DUF2958 domain-containing protein [Planctomycetota bacterium]|jgi:hypothetical protein